MRNCIIFDLDQTIADTSFLESLRKQRNWVDVYKHLNQIKVYADIYEVIEILRSRGFLIGVVTNSPKIYCVKVLDYLNIKVDCVVGYHCTTLKKPHPDPVLYCINEMGSDFNKIYGIGDSVNDIISYKRSNIICVGCLWGRINNDELIESKPDYIVNRPIDLIEILDKIL
jgi:HAD superfamily hydrolase (TIGR01549 family)